MRRLAAALLLSLTTAAAADTLIMRGTAATTPIVLRAANGDAWTCNVSALTISGQFNNLRAVTINSVQATASGCLQTSSQPAPTVGSTAFSQSSYVASGSIGVTYITVKRTGNAALTVAWSASGGQVSPASGTLSWPAGDASLRFIKLTLPKTAAVVTLALPGSTATLTVTP